MAVLAIASFSAIGFSSMPAFAQFTRDKAANQKIDEAINTHYLSMDLDKAESVLTGTIGACEDKCSPATLGKAWMYVGLVRGSGKSDQKGAAEAFSTAKSIDPNVKLDTELATPETKETFEKITGTVASAPIATASGGGGDEEAVPGEMVCTPDVRELRTRQPLPISCTTDEEATAAELKFKAFGSSTWKKIAMKKNGEFWQAEIPCDATGSAGTLEWYVMAKDGTGDDVDSLGSKKEPIRMTVSESSAAEPPAFPGQAAPARCADASDCPPDFPGCDSGKKTCGDKDWGAACDNSSECKCGLLCVSGACETAPSCTTDSDCPEGTCENGTCAASGGGESGGLKRHWIGIHGAFDLLYQGGNSDACGADSTNTSCFALGSEFPIQGEIPRNRADGPPVGQKTATGFAPGQIRFLLSYDYAFSPSMMIGLRAGYAIMGAPKDFLPVQAEARFRYYFSGLDSASFRPYVGIGGGMAEVNGRVKKTGVKSSETDKSTVDPGDDDPPLDVDIYTQAGTGFAGINAGVLWGLSDHFNLELNLINAMVMLPTFGINYQPSIGIVYAL